MRRLLCLISGMNAGGAETFLMKLYRRMNHDLYQMDFCVNITEEGFYDKEINSMGGIIFHIPSKSDSYYEFKKRLTEIIKEGKYEYVLRVTSNAMGFLDLKIAKKAGASICIARSSNSNDPSGMKIKLAHRIGTLLYSKYVDVRIAPSDLAAMYTFGKKCYANGEVNILHNALDLDVYKYDLDGRMRIREEFNVDDSDILCGHIGRFSIQKNHKFLISIFSELCKRHTNYKLLLIGEGELENEVKEQCKSLGLAGKVIFAGIRSDIPAILSAMDIFIFPSLYEGMPNTVIEAQATGLPCIISNTITKESALTDLVKNLSINDNATAWVETIEQCSMSSRGSRDSELRVAGYDINTEVKRFEKLIFNSGIGEK